MDMVINNLFKHKVHFRLSGHESNQYEPYIPSKGYHYRSNNIENAESVGITTACDLYIGKLKPLFMYIISTMFHEAEMEIDSVTITVSVIECEEYYDYDIVKYEFTSSPDDSITNYRSWVYPFPNGLLNKKIYIGMESYVYLIDDNVREMNAFYEEGSRLADEAEENRNNIKLLAPPEESYREDKCVICLESTPNILFLDCGHIAICSFCESRKRTTSLQSTCDVCRAEISRRIKI